MQGYVCTARRISSMMGSDIWEARFFLPHLVFGSDHWPIQARGYGYHGGYHYLEADSGEVLEQRHAGGGAPQLLEIIVLGRALFTGRPSLPCGLTTCGSAYFKPYAC